MAVVQISRIQVRRGRAQTGTGVPTLASGELGWAVDTRELYIGNGSVSEGAPTVGNTRILTEFSDILGEAARYAYRREEINTGASGDIERTLQSKLDDIVNVRDFGALGDNTFQREALQRAIDTLYLGADKDLARSRITLYMPAGEYKIDAPLYLPPYTRIIGDGINATRIVNAVNTQTGNAASSIFVTVNSTSTPGNPELDNFFTELENQPKNIYISGMTLEDITFGNQPASASPLVAHSTLLINCASDCVFENIEFIGSYDPSLPGASPYVGEDINQGLKDSTAIKMYSKSSLVGSNNNIFNNCEFRRYVSPVYSDYDISNNVWDSCKFSDCYFGVVFGYETNPTFDTPGQFTGPVNNRISNSHFQDIWEEGLLVKEGLHNVSENNQYFDVGNDGGGSATPATAVIRFGYKRTEISNPRYDPKFHLGNKSINDYFERTADLTVNPAFNTNAYPPEVEGAKILELNTEIETRLGTSGNNTVSIADISLSDPCVVRTVTNHNLVNGQQVLLTGMIGSTELVGRTFFVSVVDSDEFELFNDAGLTSSEDSTLYTPYGSAGAVVGSTRTYFLQVPADQQKGTILIDYIYNGVLSTNEINRKGTFTLIYDIPAGQLSFNEDYTATGNPFFANLLTFGATLDAGNRKILLDFVNTGFALGADVDNFRFTIKHIV